MHFQRGGINQESWADELVMHIVFAQDMADVLAEIAFNALAKLLHPLDIFRSDTPRAVFSIGTPRLEFWDALFHFVIPGYVRDQVLHVRERLHGLDGHRLVPGERAHAR